MCFVFSEQPQNMVRRVLSQLAAIVDRVPGKERILLIGIPVGTACYIVDTRWLLLAELEVRDSRARQNVGPIGSGYQIQVRLDGIVDCNVRNRARGSIDDPSISRIRIGNEGELGDAQIFPQPFVVGEEEESV